MFVEKTFFRENFQKIPEPIGNFVNVRFTGNLAYLSGQGAFDDEGNLIYWKGWKRSKFRSSL